MYLTILEITQFFKTPCDAVTRPLVRVAPTFGLQMCFPRPKVRGALFSVKQQTPDEDGYHVHRLQTLRGQGQSVRLRQRGLENKRVEVK